MQDVIAVRTRVIDDHLMQWCKRDNIKQVPFKSLVDSAMICNVKYTALGEIAPNCHRLALIGDVFNMPQVFRSLQALGFDRTQPSIWLVEDVVECEWGLQGNG
ncbi:uncharacterized protein HaLaN_20414, partial [Haematococcus lacustris]